MSDATIWDKFNRSKSMDSKIKLINKLRFSKDPKSLEILCEEFLKTTSSKYRNEAIYTIELLAGKFIKSIETKESIYYQKLLTKYKIDNVIDFWFRKYSVIEYHQNILEEFENEINKNYSNEISKFNLEVIFNLGINSKGYISVKFGLNNAFDFNSIIYGTNSTLRDYSADKINWFPRDQKHISNSNIPNYKILKKHNLKFKFPDSIKEEVKSYFKSNLDLNCKIKEHDLSEYLNSYSNTKNNNRVDFEKILSKINELRNGRETKKARELASITIEKMSNHISFKHWQNYLREVANE